MKTRIFCCVLAGAVSAVTCAADYSGALSEAIRWEITDSVLTVSGAGKMPSYTPTKLNQNPFMDEELAFKVKAIVIGEGITKVGDFAFGSRGDVKGSRVQREGASKAFSPLQSETTNVGTPLFANVRSVILPSTLRSIGQFAFTRLPVQSILIPEGVEEIGYSAFANTALRLVKLPSTLKRVGPEAFSTCTSMKAVDLNNLSLNLSNGMFFNCEELRMIAHPSNVTGLSASTFGATPFEQFSEAEMLKMLQSDGLENYISRNMPNRATFAGTQEAYDARLAKTIDAYYQSEAANATVIFKLDVATLGAFDEATGTCRIQTVCHGPLLVSLTAAQAAMLRENWKSVSENVRLTYFPDNGTVRLQSVLYTLPDGTTLAASPLAGRNVE